MKAEDGTNDGVADSLSEVLDPLGLARLAGDVFFGMAAHPGSLIATQLRLATAFVGIAGRAARGEGSDEHGVAPAPHDARFRHPAWSENPTLEALKDGYLLAVRTLLDAIDRADGLDDATRARLRFFAQQLCDALSPTNVPFLNPAVLEEAVASGGASLRRGLAHLLEDARDNGGRPPLVDRTKFAVGESVATSKGAVVYRNALIELIQYAPLTPSVHARPLLIVPPWINKFYVLDLRPENSFIAYAVERGFTVFAISWRNPDASLRHLTWDDYLELGPLYAARVASSITGSIDVNLIGYCIGGTLSATLLAYLAKTRERLIHATTFFASLSDFEDAGDIKAFLSESSLASIEAKMERDGVLSAADMSATFNLLRSNDLIWNVAVNRYLLGKEPPAFDLLFWNDDATRMPQAMHSWYLRTRRSARFARRAQRHLRSGKRGRPHRAVAVGLSNDQSDAREGRISFEFLRPHRRDRQPARRAKRALLARSAPSRSDGGSVVRGGGAARRFVVARLERMAPGALGAAGAGASPARLATFPDAREGAGNVRARALVSRPRCLTSWRPTSCAAGSWSPPAPQPPPPLGPLPSARHAPSATSSGRPCSGG
jgi:hypothetical protein